jgi:2-polyprenyl-6-methoxyphenol hydroxylase-like FAD-dependent oxidoreductase
MPKNFDVIVVGARCAGSPTAMLLARRGCRVLLVDRATFPSDTISTHVIQPLGAAKLESWGLLDKLIRTGCPAIDTYSFDFGPIKLSGSPGTTDAPNAYCARRTILDKLLADAAVDAGAELREGFSLSELLFDDGRVVGVRGRTSEGATVEERAEIVIGADGRRSRVAEAVHAGSYHQKPPLLAPCYSYWSNLPQHEFATYVRPYRGFAMAPTHDGLTMIVGGWPHAELDRVKDDLETHFYEILDLVPEVAERVRDAKREAPFAGVPTPNYFRKPFGPGWALVGDAGYLKDPITAQGISDAFRDAEQFAAAFDEFSSGARSYSDAMHDYQRKRDEAALPMYEMTCGLATLAPPPPEMLALFAALPGNRNAVDAFVQMNAGTISPVHFFSPENVRSIREARRLAS